MIDHVIIMAGGAGTRLWPASVQNRPKQFMRIGSEDSLINSTIKRGFSLGHSGYVIIVTHKDHLKPALEECKLLPEEMRKRTVILPEPCAKNTAPALALAACWLKSKGEEQSSVIVLAADHIINDKEGFKKSVKKASQLADKKKLVPFGITPTHAETGYGYIEAGEKLTPGREVISFKEKPDLKRALQFVAEGNYYWNSGMFVYQISLFYDELRALTPDVIEPFDQIQFTDSHFSDDQGITYLSRLDVIEELYKNITKISIDYALMEKSHKIAMIEAEFDWNDVGSWDVISEIDKSHTDSLSIEGSNNFVYGKDVQVTFCGVSDLIVVVEEGKVMICKKGESQLVKDAVEELKKQNRQELLQ